MDAAASKQYRAALDALFAKGEVGKLAEKMAPDGRGSIRTTSCAARIAAAAMGRR